jgi:autotransporter-associated beta strand protein
MSNILYSYDLTANQTGRYVRIYDSKATAEYFGVMETKVYTAATKTVTLASLAGENGTSIALGANILQAGDSTDTAFAGAISGVGGSLVKTGSGILTLSGDNTYTGDTSVNVGTLLVNGSLAADSAVSVAASATLGGAGTINGSVTIDANAFLAPGASIGTLFTGATTINGTYLVEINGTAADMLDVTGALTLDAASMLSVSGNLTETVYVIAEYDSRSGMFGAIAGADGYDVVYDYGTSQNQIALVAVPEPGTLALLAVGLLGLIAYAWRKRK